MNPPAAPPDDDGICLYQLLSFFQVWQHCKEFGSAQCTWHKKMILLYFCLLASLRTCLISLAMRNLFQKNEEFKSCCFTQNMEVLPRVMERTTDHMTPHVFVSTQKAICLKRIYMISKDFTYFSIPSNLRLLNHKLDTRSWLQHMFDVFLVVVRIISFGKPGVGTFLCQCIFPTNNSFY